MKRFPLPLLLLFLTGCHAEDALPLPEYLQEIAHLQPESALETVDSPMRAVWIPVMQYRDWMTHQTEAQFRLHVRDAFGRCAALGINTIFAHVRAYGDAYYQSDLFPKGAYLTADYDPLAILLEEAAVYGLAVHAWVNPLRCGTDADFQRMDTSLQLRQWYDTCNGTCLVQSGAHYYLNPAYPEVRAFLAAGVTELLERYPVAGIHIDDYFYPTQDAAFDAAAFAESGAADLGDWRRENCSAMVAALYDAVKAVDGSLLFGISPQGNLHTNYERLYADTARWCSEEGYCDYIVPQIYYGFANSTCPFAETATRWAETATEADLVVGLAAYKMGQYDQWAGAGSAEWQTDPTVLSQEVDLLLTLEGVDGIAFYDYASLFAPEAEMAATAGAERARIGETWGRFDDVCLPGIGT